MKVVLVAAIMSMPFASHPADGATVKHSPAAAVDTTFTVNSEDDTDDGSCDSAHCSLREAIDRANSRQGIDTIAFAIPGSGTRTIRLTTALPVIADPVVIDGTSQPDFAGTPIIELDGTDAGPAADGLHITAGNSIVRGLIVKRFANGIRLAIGGGNTVEGNIIGTDSKILQCEGNTSAGVRISTSDNTIGGTTSTAGNVISCSGTDGVYITGASGNAIQGNYIGTNSSRLERLPNARDGVRIEGAAGNLVGGPGPLDRNVISFNSGAGVGIHGSASIGNQVVGNIINGSGSDGVVLPDAGGGNRITGNSILDNGGLGIDLGADGVTPNDPGDLDTGPNNLQNFPVITSALGVLNSLFVQGSLNSRPNSDFEIEFFTGGGCNASGHGEGDELLDGMTVTTDGSGDVSFAFTFAEFSLPGDVITTTATDPDGNTSEFSACVAVAAFALTVSPDSVVVTRGADAQYSVDVSPVGGPFDSPVALSCSDLPQLTECSFAPDTVRPGASGARSILTVTTTSLSSDAATAPGRRATLAGGLWPGLLGTAFPALALLAVVFARRNSRRRRIGLSLMLALALAGSVLYTACGDAGSTAPPDGGTPRGKHEFTVTGTSGPLSEEVTGVLIVL